MSEVILGIGSLNRRLTAISGPEAGRAFMDRFAGRVEAALKLGVPRKTSHTGRSIHRAEVTPTSAKIVASPVVRWIDQGTGLFGPHHQKIVPKNAKALHFTKGTFGKGGSVRLSGNRRKGKAGRAASDVFVRSVKGMKARPFIERSVRQAAQKSGLSDVVVERWDSAA